MTIMKENGKMEKFKAMEYILKLVEMSMKANFYKIRCMEKENIFSLIMMYMKEIGKII